jgi:hypothetical protein
MPIPLSRWLTGVGRAVPVCRRRRGRPSRPNPKVQLNKQTVNAIYRLMLQLLFVEPSKTRSIKFEYIRHIEINNSIQNYFLPERNTCLNRFKEVQNVRDEAEQSKSRNRTRKTRESRRSVSFLTPEAQQTTAPTKPRQLSSLSGARPLVAVSCCCSRCREASPSRSVSAAPEQVGAFSLPRTRPAGGGGAAALLSASAPCSEQR